MDQFGHDPGLQGTPRELATHSTENSPTVGFLSLDDPADNMHQVNWSMGAVPMPSIEPIKEGASDEDTWNTFPEIFQATDLSFFPVSLGPEGPLTRSQDARVPIDPVIDFNSFGNTNSEMSRQQMSYTADINLAYDFGNSYSELVPALVLPDHIPNAVIGSSSSSENPDRLVNMPGLMIGVDPPTTWEVPSSRHSNGMAEGVETNARNAPARDEFNVTTSSLRIRGARSPPQTYEHDVGRLYDRLIREGADIGAAMFLRYIIFANGVTVDALMAPIQTGELFDVGDGANRMWKVLLETKEVIPGKKKYSCLLCPVKNRREYQYDRDAVRHFNKDHFGFSFPCEYCGRQFFKDAERKIHAKKCMRPLQ